MPPVLTGWSTAASTPQDPAGTAPEIWDMLGQSRMKLGRYADALEPLGHQGADLRIVAARHVGGQRGDGAALPDPVTVRPAQIACDQTAKAAAGSLLGRPLAGEGAVQCAPERGERQRRT